MRWIFFVKQLNTNILQSFHKKGSVNKLLNPLPLHEK
jgi:hypothetical protein